MLQSRRLMCLKWPFWSHFYTLLERTVKVGAEKAGTEKGALPMHSFVSIVNTGFQEHGNIILLQAYWLACSKIVGKRVCLAEPWFAPPCPAKDPLLLSGLRSGQRSCDWRLGIQEKESVGHHIASERLLECCRAPSPSLSAASAQSSVPL